MSHRPFSISEIPDRSVVSLITETLSQRIIAGVLAPGERLRQDHLAAEFHSSHVPVREAFRRLEAQGLVVVAPNRGVSVAPLTPEDVLEVSEMRAALECLALRHAIPQFDMRVLSEARRMASQYTTAASVAEQIATNQDFHWMLLVPCGMPRLLDNIADLHRASARQLHAACRLLDWRTRSPDEHDRLLAIVARSDAEAACRMLAEHILTAGRAVAGVVARGVNQESH
ncbi:GntR family transcriptional regulator [Roseomonas mucosa]|uniref:GntR family transcriptional regulator n=1 Tax=Roseomonas mucosa TaxID=207340 RepID=UPI00384C6265